jgi:hypothetical protein
MPWFAWRSTNRSSQLRAGGLGWTAAIPDFGLLADVPDASYRVTRLPAGGPVDLNTPVPVP